MNAWFGKEMAGTPMSVDLPEIEAPAGETCTYCGTIITEWDSGRSMPHFTDRSVVRVYQHQECSIYSVMGSRWCRAEGHHLVSAQHKRYHELQRASYGVMRPRAIERRVLLEFNEYIGEDELINNWRAH